MAAVRLLGCGCWVAGAGAGAGAEVGGGDEVDDGLLQRLGFDPVGLDALCARTGQPAAALQAELLGLELDGYIARLPGGLFQRIAQR